MIFKRYKFNSNISGIIFDTNCLKALGDISAKSHLKVNINIDYNNGNSFYDLKIKDIVEDVSIDRRHIKSIRFFAENEDTALDLRIGEFNEIELGSENKSIFMALKQEILEWLNLYKNKNPFHYFAPGCKNSEVIRLIASIVSAVLLIIALAINNYKLTGEVEYSELIIFSFTFVSCFYILNFILSSIFFKNVEIEIGRNPHSFRRKIGSWFFTVIFVPVILSWVFALI